MGVPSCRFVDRQHEMFVCPICLDVAIDPVVMNDCDHIFCKACAEPWTGPACALCNTELKDPKWLPVRGQVKRIYLDLKVRCINPQCEIALGSTTYKEHDENCPITFEICSECGLKSRRNPPSYHSCVQILKIELGKVKRLKAVEEKLSLQTQERTIAK